MPSFIENPIKDILRRIQELKREKSALKIDDQEMKEREEAARAYSRENEMHFVSYCEDCVRTSVQAMTKIRRVQRECFDVYNEEDPPNFAKKENWQSKTTIPKPHGAVQFAMAAVRKAFSVDFLSIENETDEKAAEFWEKMMKHQLNKDHSNFPVQFTDATGMGFAVGTSMEMIPVWRPGKGLQYILVEPWKIHRDPDAISRHPQSGMYWIHQEYLDTYVLKAGAERGRYVNVDEAISSATYNEQTHKDDPNLSKAEIDRRKHMLWTRSSYRRSVLTSEFWGTVLDSKGNLLLPNSTYTIAGRRVVRIPKVTPYPTLRWPGISFSPLPHFLRHDGRGLLQGVKRLWYLMCSLLCLHADAMNWVVNPPVELDISSFVDPEDVDDYPGKRYLTRGTVSGQQAVRPVERKNITNEVLANLEYEDQNFQRGTFITDAVQGLPGWRQDMTAREAAQNLEQAMGVFGLIGINIEDGALDAIKAGAETVEINAGVNDLKEVLSEEEITERIDPQSPTGVRLPRLNGSFHVSGVSAVMKDMEVIRAIRDVILPMFDKPGSIFVPYLKPHKLLRSIERRLNLRDEGIIVDENTAQQIDEAQQQAQEEAIQKERAIKTAEAGAAAKTAEAPEQGWRFNVRGTV
jgi:hypothetical protein